MIKVFKFFKIAFLSVSLFMTFFSIFMYLYLTFNLYLEQPKVYWITLKFVILPAMFLAYLSCPLIYDLAKHIKTDDIFKFGFDKWRKKKINYQRRSKVFIWLYLTLNFIYFPPYFIMFSNQIFGDQKTVKINSTIMSVSTFKMSKSNRMWYIYIYDANKGICLLSDKEFGTYDSFNETLKIGCWGLYYKLEN